MAASAAVTSSCSQIITTTRSLAATTAPAAFITKSRVSIGHQWSAKPSFQYNALKSTKCTSAPCRAMAEESVDKVFHGECFVVQDNIDTDQIIPAEYLTLVPSKPDEYEKLGSYAMCGLPANYPRFIEQGETKTKYPVIIAGPNFGCGSSREHAPVALGAAGVRAVVAESYARIFFRNSVATGELYPVESDAPLASEFKTGDIVTVDLGKSIIINHSQNKQYLLKPLGDAGPVIDAGGLFAYARQTGMIATA